MVLVVAAATFAFVFGFAYGDLLGGQYGFRFQDWQTLGSAMVAFGAATVAYLGVRGTQRINVMIKEEERIDSTLPGLRQTHDLLDFLVTQVDLPPQLRYVADQAIRSIVRPQDGETYEAVVARMIPLADGELRRDVTAAVFRLSTQAGMLKVMKDEIDRTEADLAAIDTFAPNSHQAVREQAQRTKAANEREVATFLSILDAVKQLRTTLASRIMEAEQRRKIIRRVVDKYFQG